MDETDERICESGQVVAATARYYREGWDKKEHRLGQYLINNLAPISTRAPEIFYEEDARKAVDLFYKRYVIVDGPDIN